MLEAGADVLVRTARFVALAACLFGPLEALWPRQARLARRWWADLAWLAAGALTLSLVVGPALRWAERDLHHEGWRVLLAFLGAEVMAYLVHRAMHEVPALWRFHRVHHEPARLSWTAAWRQHPVDVALHALAVALPGLALGVALSSFGVLVLLRRLWTGLLHANVRFDLGPLEGVIATPKFHHLHHSPQPRFFNANYAGLLPVLDVLGGTRRTDAPRRGRRGGRADQRPG